MPRFLIPHCAPPNNHKTTTTANHREKESPIDNRHPKHTTHHTPHHRICHTHTYHQPLELSRTEVDPVGSIVSRQMPSKNRKKRTHNSIHAATHSTTPWNPTDYPYETEYNDHFETPLEAYQDVKPIIDWLFQHRDTKGDAGDGPSSPIVYDPYYCHGRARQLLHTVGYDRVAHAKRDFYADVRDGAVPTHDILVTNPPYSDTHKRRCLEVCFEQLLVLWSSSSETTTDDHRRASSTPFLLLMPAYVATKEYYRERLYRSIDGTTSSNNHNHNHTRVTEEDVVYLIPSSPYHYEHPEHTGKDTSPFASLWFIGVGRHKVAALRQYWETRSTERGRDHHSRDSSCHTHHGRRPTLATSLAELEGLGVVSTRNRPNPKQRRKQQQRRHPGMAQPTTTTTTTIQPKSSERTPTTGVPVTTPSKPTLSHKPSKYRDGSGQRKKRRF